jgi:hypothetical protein
MIKKRLDELDRGRGSKRLYNYVRVCSICKRYHRTSARRGKTICFECNKLLNKGIKAHCASFEILENYGE